MTLEETLKQIKPLNEEKMKTAIPLGKWKI